MTDTPPPFFAQPLATPVCDMHICVPLSASADLSGLARYAASGASFVSLNVGIDSTPLSETIKLLAQFRAWVLAHPEHYTLIQSVQDIVTAQQEKKLGVAFDLEGASLLQGQVSMVALLYQLGVRSMCLAYNQSNALASGCAEEGEEDTGLTSLGRSVVAAMNEVGMLVDCVHTGYRATMEIMQVSTQPVIFSHANPRQVWDHFRNISDEQIKACAATGGVVGINGVNWFLGDAQARTETIVKHIDYVAQLVGPEYVGLGLDYVFDASEAPELQEVVQRWSNLVLSGFQALAFASPEQLPEIAQGLWQRGYTSEAVQGIMGGNYLRVARQVWK